MGGGNHQLHLEWNDLTALSRSCCTPLSGTKRRSQNTAVVYTACAAAFLTDSVSFQADAFGTVVLAQTTHSTSSATALCAPQMPLAPPLLTLCFLALGVLALGVLALSVLALSVLALSVLALGLLAL